MAYKQKRKYGFRDSLEKGNPEKVIYGEYFDDEFEAIEKAIADIDPNSDGNINIIEIEGLQDALDDKADKDHTHDEYLTDAPNDGKQYVRESESWAEVVIPDDTGIPEPNADATPYARQVEGGQTEGAWVEAATPEDIEYLDGRIDAIEGNISGGGGFVEAPDDGNDYARNGKSPAWVKTYNAEYIDDLETAYKNADADKADKDHTHEIADVDGLQTELDGKADAGHNHTTDEITGLDDKIDEIEGDITDLEGAVGSIAGQLAMGGSYDASTGLVVIANLSEFTAGQSLPDYSTVPNTFVIVSVAGNNPEELSEGDWLVAGQSGWVPIKYGTAGSVDWDNIQNVPDFDSIYAPISHGHAWDEITGKPTEFPPEAHNHDGVYQPVGDYLTDAPNDGAQYVRESGAWAEVTIPEAGGSVQIGDTFDGTPVEGDQWLETPAGGEAVMWIYDGEKWLQMPGGGGSGQDGITTATLPLANPTREATGLSTQSDANNYFAEAIAKVVNEDGEVALTDYYTKAESDAAYQPKGDYIGEAPNDGEEYARKGQGWVKLQDHNYTGADAVKLTGDQSVAGHKTWTGVSTFGDTVTMRGTLNGDDTANFQNAVTAGSFVKAGGTASQLLCADGSVSDSSEYALASKFVICTQAEYDGLTPSADTVYFIT